MHGRPGRLWWSRIWWGQWIAFFAGAYCLAITSVAAERGSDAIGPALIGIGAFGAGVGLRALAIWREHLEARS